MASANSTRTPESGVQSRIISACTGAVFTSLLMTPFDVVKTRQQSRTLVRTERLSPTVREWRAVRAGSKGLATPSALYSCLCDPTAGLRSKLPSQRTSASLCMCLDNDKHGFFTSSNNKIGETWKRVYSEVVAVPRSILERSLASASASVSAAKSPISPGAVAASRSAAVDVARGSVINGTIAGMRHIAQTEGIATLWRGLSPTLVASGPSTVIYFVGYDYMRQWMGRKMRQGGWGAYEKYASLLAGCMARTAAVTAISPIELVRTRMQSSATHDFGTVMRGITREVQAAGIGSLWRGLVPTLWRDVPFSAIYWFGYERWRENVYGPLFSEREDMFGRLAIAFFSGASSGVVAATLTTPFDVAKTRRQIEQHADSRSHVQQHRRLPQIVRHIVATEGLGGLFAGLAPRLMKVAPSCAIMISSYELGKMVLS